jgi:hypothetical protein
MQWQRKVHLSKQTHTYTHKPRPPSAGSYSCWASTATDDPEHHCFFPEDANSKDMDPAALCALDWTDSLTVRYPRLTGPPIDSGASHLFFLGGGGEVGYFLLC